jgi:hypothetical protein
LDPVDLVLKPSADVLALAIAALGLAGVYLLALVLPDGTEVSRDE